MNRRSAARRRQPYHHGDLAAALVAAAAELVAERGVEGFTLREAARRAGVSHAAPAHHFGDARGLLTELAAAGFERLTAEQAAAAAAESSPAQRVNAIGAAYVHFAISNPALFRLMFHSKLIDRASERFRVSGRAAFGVFLEAFSAARGHKAPALTPAEAGRDPLVLRQWAVVHGLATLSIEGQLGPTGPSARKRLLAATREALEAAAGPGRR